MKTALHLKVDKNIKERAKELSDIIGIPLSTIMNALLIKFVRNGGLVFSANIEPLPKEIEKELIQIDNDIDNNKNVSREIHGKKDLEQFFEAL